MAVAPRSLRGFGPLGLLAILAIVAGTLVLGLLGGLLVLAWVRASQTPWRELGYVRPKSWVADVVVGIALGVLLKLLLKAVVMPLLGAEAFNPAYHYLRGNTAALPGMLFMLIVSAGFGEETVYRGFLFERLGKLLGTGAAARGFIVLLTSAAFALAHYPEQGFAGFEQAVMTGLVFGTTFATTSRIWLPMCMHAAYDLAALAIIYWDVEYDVAHLFVQ